MTNIPGNRSSTTGLVSGAVPTVRTYRRALFHQHQGPDANYDRVARHYDRFAARWDQIANRAALRQFRALIRQHVHPGTRLLDVGTGTGRSMALVYEAAAPRHSVGLARSRGMLSEAGEKFAGSDTVLVQGDAVRLPFADDTFDLVISMWVLETLPDPLRALHEMLRVVRPGGQILTLFSSRPAKRFSQLIARLLEWIAYPQLGWTFLLAEKQPLSACTLPCTDRRIYGLNTMALFGKGCQLASATLVASTTSIDHRRSTDVREDQAVSIVD